MNVGEVGFWVLGFGFWFWVSGFGEGDDGDGNGDDYGGWRRRRVGGWGEDTKKMVAVPEWSKGPGSDLVRKLRVFESHPSHCCCATSMLSNHRLVALFFLFCSTRSN